ncbi:MAG: hypothetical protein ACOVMN_03970, partial [Flexibacteraceae bacterium]
MKNRYLTKILQRNKLLAWLFGLLFLLPGISFAQLQYSFTQTNAPFVPLDATATTQRTGGNVDDFPSINGIALPFTFVFAETSHTTVSINNNGAVFFGATAPTTFNDFTTANPNTQFIMGLATDLSSGTAGTIKTNTLGTAPNRVFVVEYLNYVRLTPTTSQINFQILLFEGSNRIEIHYGPNNNGGTGGLNANQLGAMVGLRNNAVTDFFTRTATGTGNTVWENTTVSAAALDRVPFIDGTQPNSGLKYIFTPVPPAANDLAVNGLIEMPSGAVICDSTSLFPGIIVRNRGVNAATPNLLVTVSQGTTVISTQPVLGSSIAASGFDTLYLTTPVLLPSLGAYNVTVNLLGGDDVAVNDTLRSTVTVNRNCNDIDYTFAQSNEP